MKTMTLVEGREAWTLKQLQGFINGCTKRGVKPNTVIGLERDGLNYLVLSVPVPDDTPVLPSGKEAREAKAAEEKAKTVTRKVTKSTNNKKK